MNIYKAFVYMFYALDAMYDENPNEELGNYLSGLNPFLFEDEGSADPAEYEEFKSAYIKHFGDSEPSPLEVYEFCKSYISDNAPKEAIVAFEQVEKPDWITSFEENEE